MAGQNDFRIFLHKQQVEGETIVSAASPDSAAPSSPSPAKQKSFMNRQRALALANQSFNALATDLKAEGNERMATQMSNFGSSLTMAFMIAKFPPAAIPLAISEGFNQISRYRDRQRTIKNNEFEIEQRGTRLSRGQRASYLE